MAQNHLQGSTASTLSETHPPNVSDQTPHPPSPTPDGTPTSQPAPDAQTKPKKRKKSSGQKQGRGRPSIFQGEHLLYLESRGKEYLALSGKKDRTRWLAGLEEDWFTKYPWHLSTEPEEFSALHAPVQANPAGTEGQSISPVQLSEEERQALKKRRKVAHDAVVKEGQEVKLSLPGFGHVLTRFYIVVANTQLVLSTSPKGIQVEGRRRSI